jgi:hypothetical protein
MSEDNRKQVFAKIDGVETLVGHVKDEESGSVEIFEQYKADGVSLVDVEVRDVPPPADFDAPIGEVGTEGLVIEAPIEPTTRREGRL